MFDFIKNRTIYRHKYHVHHQAVIISCYYNPQRNPYRLKAFRTFYDSIRHLPHLIIECVIGDVPPELETSSSIVRVFTRSMLWHKETLLNKAVEMLPQKYKYVFWVDADVLFTNPDWITEGVAQLQSHRIIQPFDYCVHLEKDELKPSFSMEPLHATRLPNAVNPMVWRSFCANYATNDYWKDEVYNHHGHVGFAWAARREVLEQVPLYDRALVGGADHIVAHAAAGQIPHTCIAKSFTENIQEVEAWSRRFYAVTEGKIGFVQGDLYHLWHGDLEKREYLKRIREFTGQSKGINDKDEQGMYVAHNGEDTYVKEYYEHRESITDQGITAAAAVTTGMAASNLLDELRDRNATESDNDSGHNDSSVAHHPGEVAAAGNTDAGQSGIAQAAAHEALHDPFS